MTAFLKRLLGVVMILGAFYRAGGVVALEVVMEVALVACAVFIGLVLLSGLLDE